MATKVTLAALAKLDGCGHARANGAERSDDPAHFKEFSVTLDDLLFDYSKQRIDAAVLARSSSSPTPAASRESATRCLPASQSTSPKSAPCCMSRYATARPHPCSSTAGT